MMKTKNRKYTNTINSLILEFGIYDHLISSDFQIGPVFSKIKLFNDDVLVNETDKFIDPLSQSSFKKYLDVK